MTFAGAAVLVLSAYVSLYRDIHHDMVLVVVLFLAVRTPSGKRGTEAGAVSSRLAVWWRRSCYSM